MSKLWQLIRGYVWWTYPRGSLHYDVMVTLILAFIFITPLWVDFGDKPVKPSAHQTQVAVTRVSDGQFVFLIDAKVVSEGGDAAVQQSLLQVIEPIAGEVTIERYERDRDHYRVWVVK